MTPSTPDRLQLAGGSGTRSSESIDRILLDLCGRIDALLIEEDRLLGSADPEALNRLIDRKEHLALEVSRLVRIAEGYVPAPAARSGLSRTLDSLARHTVQVRRHVEAVRSITAMISDLYCEVTSDGTYEGATHFKAVHR